MRIEGALWEKRIYPLALCGPGRRIRRWCSEEAIIETGHRALNAFWSLSNNPYRNAVIRAYSMVFPRSDPNQFFREHLRFVWSFYLRMATIFEAKPGDIKSDLQSRLSVSLDPLRDALSRGKAVVCPFVHLNIPIQLLFADLPPPATTLNLLLHREIPQVCDLIHKADAGWRFIFLEDSPSRQLIASLRSNQIVACNIDHVYPGTEVTLADVLGRPAIVPSGIFRLAYKLDTPVVPIVMSEINGLLRLEATDCLRWDRNVEMPISDMLARVHFQLNRAILQAPEQWLGWGNLLYRWTSWRTKRAAASVGTNE